MDALAPAVPDARDEIHANVVGEVDVAPKGVGHDQGGPSLPELSLAVAMDNLRAGVRGAALLEKTVSLTADGVGQSRVAERKLVTWVKVVFMLPLKPAWLTELIVGERLA